MDIALSVYRNWHGGGPLDPSVRHFAVYVAFLPIVREYHGARGYRWRVAWVFGRVRGGRNLHLGLVGFVWTG